ncbi:hypothetical protein J5J10_12405 [Ciceribacter sp. L1K23]|uniref:hypothetical protein n=1 Tax=Ciceribacter sp. L1K23 TaxID=2820276 RepID=UPI001B8191FE|nr:hypothetical protein [Ciceribacter sp. L1K23]MBR0556480.1 hypothetical protein [Ciceribacter sp. L1K23]
MRTRTILLSIAGAAIAVATIDGLVSLVSTRDAAAGPLDLAAVSKIRVSGTASEIEITTKSEGPLTAELSGERHGWAALWRSSWFSDACPAEGSLTVDGDTLLVDVGRAPHFLDWSDCRMTLSANAREGTAVIIDQKAARMTLDGEFSLVQVNSDAGDFHFTGHAHEIDVAGAALRARLAFERVANDEVIAISGKMLDATLRFLTPTPVSYAVETIASYVDSALPNTPGAKPSIRIKGEMARVRIE